MTIWSQYQVDNTTLKNHSVIVDPRNTTAAPVKMVIITLEFTLNAGQIQGWKPTKPSIGTTLPMFFSSTMLTPAAEVRKPRILNMMSKSEMKEMSDEGKSHRNELMEQVEDVLKQVSPENRVRMTEQFLLLCLIFARWLLPRAGITRQQLSQLLLVNIGMGADILELFEAFKEPIVRKDLKLTMAILSLWQASLLQFCLTKTATKARKIRGGFSQTLHKSESCIKLPGCLFCETELWAISTSVLLQDGPFLILRLLLLIHYRVVSYSNIFFTTKNTLVIVLQLFRIGVILFEHRGADQDDEEEVSISRSKKSISVLLDNNSEKINRGVVGNSLSAYPATSIHSLFQKRPNPNAYSQQMPRCYSQNQVCCNNILTLSSLV